MQIKDSVLWSFVNFQFQTFFPCHKIFVFGNMLENRLVTITKKTIILTSINFLEMTNKQYALILPLSLKQRSLIPHCSSLPMNQSKTISGEEMLSEKYNWKNTSRENWHSWNWNSKEQCKKGHKDSCTSETRLPDPGGKSHLVK